MLRFLTLAVTLGAFGCSLRPVNLRKSAVVPHPAPPSWGGQALPSRVGLGFRSSNLVFGNAPSATPGRPTGVYVTQSQAGLDARIRVWDRLEINGLAELGVDATASSTTDDVVARPTIGPSIGLGAGSHYTFFSGPFQLGLGLDLLIHSLPVRVTDGSGVQQTRNLVLGYSGSVVPSYRQSDRLVFFGGVTGRNHPTIRKESTEILLAGESPEGAESGPANVVVALGAVLQLSETFLVHGQVYHTVTDAPVTYQSPGVDLGITFLLGEMPPARAPADPPRPAPTPATPPARAPTPPPESPPQL